MPVTLRWMVAMAGRGLLSARPWIRLDEVGRKAAGAGVRSRGCLQSGVAVGAVAGVPALQGPQPYIGLAS